MTFPIFSGHLQVSVLDLYLILAGLDIGLSRVESNPAQPETKLGATLIYNQILFVFGTVRCQIS